MISFIAAITQNHVLARDGKLPWHLRTDLDYYHDKVRGHMAVVGRSTFDDTTRDLTDREIIVITRESNFVAEGVTVAHSIDEALTRIKDLSEEVFVIGGGQIFTQMLPYADRLYLTEIDIELEGDVFFPELNSAEWREISREHHVKDDQNDYDFDFVVYNRTR